MLYITRKSCVFPRQMELPATQEKTANPGKSPTNPRRMEFATTQTNSACAD
jgi:hypothetical protein